MNLKDIWLVLQTFPGYFWFLLWQSPMFGGIALVGAVLFALIGIGLQKRSNRPFLQRLLIALVLAPFAGIAMAVAAWAFMMFQWGQSLGG